MAAALAACQPGASNGNGVTGAVSGVSPAGLKLVPLTVTKKDGTTHRFAAEVAATPEQQQKGMMFRETMGDDEAMIFPYDPPIMASFWMKNTLVPLDIIFIKPDGRIGNIVANAAPMSEDFRLAVEPTSLVLEIRGGRAAEIGIAAGDKVEWPK